MATLLLALLANAQDVSAPAPASPAPAAPPSTKKGSDFRTAEGLGNWTYDYDVSALKPGTYNILARATDAAGNVSFATPFNLIVDPASDLPIAGIVNPLPLARVGADLNVLGTCVDDDAVDYVELRLDGGDWLRARGADYWSYYLATSELADGLHTLAVRGVDVFGLAGKETTVSFHLDRTKPLHGIGSPAFGSIVSGRVSVSGTVFDANGLASVSYSMDAGTTWSQLRTSYDKRTKTAAFSLGVDTRKLPDGPAVLWLRSVDLVGSAGSAVFLYFVDNTKPELTVLSPAEGQAVNGRFELRGRVYDTVGVSSLSWSYEKAAGNVELLPGNPYFSLPLEAPDKAGPLTAKLVATDVAGNVSSVTVTRQVDPKADLPLVELAYPAAGSTLEGQILVVGRASDDDGVQSITWKVDQGSETIVPATGAFSFTVDGAASGARTLSVRATDSNGIAGPWLLRPFTYSGAAPTVRIAKATDASGERDYRPGVSVSTLEGKAFLSGAVEAANPLAQLWLTIGGGAPTSLPFAKTASGATYAAPLPAALPYGVLDVEIRAVDAFGKEGSARAPVLAVDYSRPRVGPVLDFGLASEPSAESPALVALREARPFSGAFVTPFDGEGIRAVSLEPPTDLVAAGYEGSIVVLSRRADGVTAPTMVSVETERGHRFAAGPFIFSTDGSAPSVTISEPAFGAWVRGDTELVVMAEDGDAVAAVEYSVDAGPWQAMAMSGQAYRATLAAPGSDGPRTIEVRAADSSGNAAMAAVAVMADATPPAPARLLPRDGDSLAGPTLFAVSLGEGLQSLDRAEFGRLGAYEALNATGSIVSFQAEVGTGPLELRVVDKAGNVTAIDLLAGLVTRDAVPSAPEPLASIKSNAGSAQAGLEGPRAEFSGKDAVGAVSWTAPILAPADGAAPTDALFAEYAAAPIRASGELTLSAAISGVALDPKKPIAAWGFRPDAIDQPLSMKKGASADAWTASFKIPARPDGPTALWIVMQDAAKGAVYSMVALEYDSTPPAIEIVAPRASSGKASAAGPFMLVVRAADASGIASLSYEAGAEKGGLDLVPGSGDAAKAFSFPPKSSALAITVRAVDGSGNRSSSTVTVAYDAASDAPVARILYPADGAAVAARPGAADSLGVIVHALDDDAVDRISLTLDGVAFQAQGPGPLYRVDVGSPSVGRRSLAASAADTAGVASAKAAAAFSQAGAPPELRLDAVARSAEPGSPTEPFAAGSALVIDGKTSMQASFSAGNGLSRIEYSINGGPWSSMAAPKPDQSGSYTARIALPATLPYDRNLLAARVTDAAGLVAERATALYRVAPPKDGASVVAEGVYIYDARVPREGDSPEGASPVVLAPGQTLGALWHGRPARSVALEPPLSFAEVSFDGPAVILTVMAEGGASTRLASVIRVETIDGDVFRSAPFTLVADAGIPAVQILEPVSGKPVTGPWRLSGAAADPNGISSLQWSADGGSTWNALPASPAPSSPGSESVAFDLELEPEAPDGAVGILVRAVDGAGAQAVALSAVGKDTLPPGIVFESPRSIDTVNGIVLVSGYAEDAFSVASIEFSADGQAWERLDSAPRGSGALSSAATRGAPPSGAGGATSAGAVPAGGMVRAAFSRLVDLGSLPSGGASMSFRATDAAGNAATTVPLDPAAPAFVVDIAADKPTVQIQIPADAEVVRSDTTVSGMAFDDDGIRELFWRLDGGEWTRLEGANGFAVPFRLLDLSDNEHLFEAYAVDLNGVEGEIASRTFRVSREEPVGRLDSPGVEIMNLGVITLSGEASDANGVASVLVSFDHGATYNAAVGTTSWSYTLDTRTIPDGVHAVYLRLADGYDTPGFAAGLISVDNTAPTVKLDAPEDGWEGLSTLRVGGRVTDGVAVESMSLSITRIGASDPETVVELKSSGVFSRDVDIRALAPGWYNVKAVALDKAGNAAYDSRNVLVLESRKADYAEIVFPAHGEPVSGRFTVDGRVVSAERIERAAVSLDGRDFAVVALSRDGWFSLAVDAGSIADGVREFRVAATAPAGASIASEPRSVEYAADGPWIDIVAVKTGDFIVGRPYLLGTSGWETPAQAEEGKDAAAAQRRLVADRRPVRVDVSRDNGKTWQEASGSAAFKYRLETQEYPDGALRLLVRATYANGMTAVRKRMVVLDTEPPAIDILKPAENGRYNGVVPIEGTASDANGLTDVSVVLRSGDKSSYEVPGFIQGSYADMHVLGATRLEGAVGLSFFDDNVRLQLALGKGFDAQPTWNNILGFAAADTPAGELSRFGGYVLGARLLANLAYVPFSYWLGPDWDFFSMSFTLGASFTYFSMRSSIAEILSPPEGRYMVLSGVVGQWEFAKFDFGWSVFKSIGLYIEGGLVFIPSEASTRLEEFIRPNVAFGVRIGLF